MDDYLLNINGIIISIINNKSLVIVLKGEGEASNRYIIKNKVGNKN